jgi:hypothetical protein
MGNISYTEIYRNTNFRKYPDKYRIGRGEQGVLMAEPYKSEILPHWRFRTPDVAKESAETIYGMFKTYLEHDDFVGADMARKFLQMGWTRSRRYANHASGKKYDADGNIKPQDKGSENSDKAESARVFFEFYQKAKDNQRYIQMKKDWLKREKILFS